MKTDVGFAPVAGARLYYEAAGVGPPLLLLHAGIADRRMWEPQFHRFAEIQHRVIRYDRRGFGRSPLTAGSYSHHQDLRDLMRFLAIERAVLAGCSQGARIALDFALVHPAMVEALVLVAPSVGGFAWDGPAPRQQAELEAAEAAGDLERVNELEIQIWVDGPERSPHQVPRPIRELVREMNRIALAAPAGIAGEDPLEPPAGGRLAEIRCPALVVCGDLDTLRTRAATAFLAAGIAGAERLAVPAAAHLPNLESPEEFNRTVLGFLQRGSAAPL